ncbi:ribonuclease H-like domain-containing protein, partial [Tanacetum coccineum]
QGTDTAYLLLSVDDIVLTASFEYMTEILERAHMVLSNPCRKPIDTESKLGDNVQQFCLHMHDLREPHFSALKRILRYCRGILDHGLQLYSSSTTSLHQLMLSLSRVEAEYHGVANVVFETCWLRNLLCELHTPLSSVNLAYCDNVSVLYLSSNMVQHQRTKHIKIDIHSVRDLVVVGRLGVSELRKSFETCTLAFIMSLHMLVEYEHVAMNLTHLGLVAATIGNTYRYRISQVAYRTACLMLALEGFHHHYEYLSITLMF